MTEGRHSRLRLAFAWFSEEMHAGLELELQKKNRMEVFRKLKFVGKLKQGSKKMISKSAKKAVKKTLNLKMKMKMKEKKKRGEEE